MRTGREKIEAALGPDGSVDFAAVTCYQGLWLRDHWDEATDAPWWAWHDPNPERASRPWIQLAERSGDDWYPVTLGACRREQQDFLIEADGDAVFVSSRSTGRRRPLHREPPGGFQPGPEIDDSYPGHGKHDRDALLSAMTVAFGTPGFAPPYDGRLDLPRLLHRALGADRRPLGHVSAPWWRCSILWGFRERMALSVERPDLVRTACDRFMEHCVADVRMLASMGVRAVWIEDCMGDLIGRESFRALELAYLRPLCDAIRAAGMLSVHYYCGDPADRWDMLLDTGADALALEESKKAFRIDIVDVADRVAGRMALLGNLDAIWLLEHGADSDVKAEVARQCEAGRRNKGRFVASIGSPVTPGTPLARVRRYCDLVHGVAR